MLIQQKKGNINTQSSNKAIDWLQLEWYEMNKRVWRKRTMAGKEVSLKFLQENPSLTQGDILFEDEQIIIAIEILRCDSLVILPKNMFEMASICYEIGNKHLPLFFEEDALLVPFEMPLFRLLTAQGYEVKQEKRKLLQPLKTSVAPHGNEQSTTLFSKIMKLTNNE
ncbi:MAG: urease accessory protein UreE [Ferruginibacter sp.]